MSLKIFTEVMRRITTQERAGATGKPVVTVFLTDGQEVVAPIIGLTDAYVELGGQDFNRFMLIPFESVVLVQVEWR